MYKVLASNLMAIIDVNGGFVSSLKIGTREVCVGNVPLFRARLRKKDGELVYIDSKSASLSYIDSTKIIYTGFEGELSCVTVKISGNGGANISWSGEVVSIPCDYAVEWLEMVRVCLPRLKDNDELGGEILFPYDEGILISNETLLPRYEPEFPSSGAYFTFPNKVCSQFMAYLFDNCGLYIGAHDTKRGLKGVDFYPYENALSLQMRLYSGCDFGQDFIPDFPVTWQACPPKWEDAANIYRNWFEDNLPCDVIPVRENESLPNWYKGLPLVVTYPVRGWHDYDSMEPNALFPFTNALPILNKIKKKSKTQIMALLMHWEGTAPWAPPYVWPPYGGEEGFHAFKDALHKNGDLLGVYCSGFGYTLHSKLTDYNNKERIEKENVLAGVCNSPKGVPELGITCPYQRIGYDICPVSKRGREILDESFAPLFENDIDYIQILDQNHGGGQYMCYARDHGHPPMPGEWMTSHMQKLLKDWKKAAPNTLFGCESAAAEPFISGLVMSDNRFELNYPYGKVVPVFAYLYHEYLHNFMGNQCGCPFEPKCDTLRRRLAYSFSIGDIMTLTLAPNGNLMSHWGTHDFESAPDMEKTLKFVKNVTKFYTSKAKEYLLFGKMKGYDVIECETVEIPQFRGQDFSVLPRLFSTSWEAKDGKSAYIVVNPESTSVRFTLNGKKYTAKPLNATLIIK